MIFLPSPSLIRHLKKKDLWEGENANCHGFSYLFFILFALVQGEAPWALEAVSMCAVLHEGLQALLLAVAEEHTVGSPAPRYIFWLQCKAYSVGKA